MSKYLVVKEIDGGGCFGPPTYKVYLETNDLESAEITLDIRRYMDKRDFFKYKIIERAVK